MSISVAPNWKRERIETSLRQRCEARLLSKIQNCDVNSRVFRTRWKTFNNQRNQPYPADAKQENEKTSKARYSSDDRHFH